MLENPLVQLGIVFGSITAFIIIGCAIQAAVEVLAKFVDFKLKGSYISAKAAIKDFLESEQEEMAWMAKQEEARAAWRKIAHLKPLHMHFARVQDYIVGDMVVCTGIDDMPTYLTPFKCSMSKRPWGHPEDDECIGVIIFARDSNSIIEYMKQYEHKVPDNYGFEYDRTNYIYDGVYTPLQICDDLTTNLRYSQAAFVIDYKTGRNYQNGREYNAA
jgi:hypothetical protein